MAFSHGLQKDFFKILYFSTAISKCDKPNERGFEIPRWCYLAGRYYVDAYCDKQKKVCFCKGALIDDTSRLFRPSGLKTNTSDVHRTAYEQKTWDCKCKQV